MPIGTITGLTFDDLDLDASITSGQVFRFAKDKRDKQDVWRGVIENQHTITLWQDPVNACVHWEGESGVSESNIRRFLRLDDLDLPQFATQWAKDDAYFAHAWAVQPGVRLLRQDPHECFFSFLCASVAPIKRISGMVCAIAPSGEKYPSTTQLQQFSESDLRGKGLGFRATRVVEAATTLATLPPDFLFALRDKPHSDVQEALTQFHGVGRKIADCVALFSMDKDEAVPIDVHIWRMAQNQYDTSLQGVSLTSATYQKATNAFHRAFGEKVGWAQQILFYRAIAKSPKKPVL
jgi:N-glycosylase/DNA lyase